MSAAGALLDALPRATLVVGKGGVGKTTCAAALALHSARAGVDTLLVTTDPARALPDVLGVEVGARAARVGYAERLEARLLDAAELRGAFIDRWGTVLRLILDRGTYLDDADIAPLVDTALPGGDEIFAALELARLLTEPAFERRRLFIDTAPTGHTLRLLELPRTFRALVRLLDAMQGKHRFMVQALTRAYRADAADTFLAEMESLVNALDAALRDRRTLAAVLVTNEQPLVLEESRRYASALRGLGLSVAAVVWNGARGPVPGVADGAPAFLVPRLSAWPTGDAGLSAWAAAMQRVGSRGAGSGERNGDGGDREGAAGAHREPAGHPESRVRLPDLQSVFRPLTIVAGKGGVGKTTVAAALALHAPARATLVVSTDPAPSLADALAQEIPDVETPIAGAAGVRGRQMDANAAFARMRDEYASRVDALFDSIMGRGMDLAADRGIVRDLLALAPPGIDEIYAMSLLADALGEGQYDVVIVDPAPTGHLLRMLEMPRLALAWTHQLLRMMLKYKEVAGLGEAARDVLEFSRRLRTLDDLLRDPARAAVVLVTLDEPVVRAETARLADAVRDRGVSVSGIILNRADAPATALPVRDAPRHLEAPTATPAPAGVAALRAWVATWRDREETRKA